MDQIKIGKFIALCRKEKGYTQSYLAEKLGISDRAISKWENGKNMPDVSLMPCLCDLLGISINELLSGDRLNMDDYKKMAEENLKELTRLEYENNKKLLALEDVILLICLISFLVMILAGVYAVDNIYWQIILIVIGIIILIIGSFLCLKIEHDVGYYCCPNCNEKYVPSMKDVILAPHIGKSRLFKCPYCGKTSFHKKVLIK